MTGVVTPEITCMCCRDEFPLTNRVKAEKSLYLSFFTQHPAHTITNISNNQLIKVHPNPQRVGSYRTILETKGKTYKKLQK